MIEVAVYVDGHRAIHAETSEGDSFGVPPSVFSEREEPLAEKAECSAIRLMRKMGKPAMYGVSSAPGHADAKLIAEVMKEAFSSGRQGVQAFDAASLLRSCPYCGRDDSIFFDEGSERYSCGMCGLETSAAEAVVAAMLDRIVEFDGALAMP